MRGHCLQRFAAFVMSSARFAVKSLLAEQAVPSGGAFNLCCFKRRLLFVDKLPTRMDMVLGAFGAADAVRAQRYSCDCRH